MMCTFPIGIPDLDQGLGTLELDARDTSHSVREWLLAAGVSLGTALLVIAPFLWLGNVSGHDFGFHVSSWMDVAGQWKEGIIYPRWTEWANRGFGEPRFIFYPPLSWILGAGLGILVPWRVVPCAFIALVQTLAGVSSYILVRRFFSNKAALAGAVCYAANPYALLDIYLRSAFGELLACAFLPVVVLAALELCGEAGNRRRSLPQAVAFFVVVFAAVWLSDVPAGIMASYIAALIFAWAAIEKKALMPLLNGASGLALAFGLMGFYLVPVAYEQRWVHVASLLPKGLLPTNNFLYAQHYAEAGLWGIPFSWIASNVATLLIVMTGMAGIAAHREIVGRKEKGHREKLWRVLLLLSAATTFLMIRPSSLLWTYLPKLLFVQFPWRWMAILAIPYAFFLGTAIERRRRGWIWGAVVFVLVGGTAIFAVHNGRSERRWDAKTISFHRQSIANGSGFGGTGEYFPREAGEYNNFVITIYSNFAGKVPEVQVLPAKGAEEAWKSETHIKRWTAEEREVEVRSPGPALVGLRLLNYPAWRIEVNGKDTKTDGDKTVGQIIVRVPAGDSDLHVRFTRTPDRLLGGALSVTSIFVLLTVYLVRHHALPKRCRTNTAFEKEGRWPHQTQPQAHASTDVFRGLSP